MRRFLFQAITIAALFSYAGCAHGVKTEEVFTHEDWSRSIIKSGLDPESVSYPFNVTPAMQAWVDEVVLRGKRGWTEAARLEWLQQSMFDKQFDFKYDDSLTLTAGQAFEIRRGNCMSFTALFIALARAGGVNTFLLSVRRTPHVNKDEDLLVVNHHVVAAHKTPHELLVFDFLRLSEEPILRQRVVDDVLATAMYHNNIGALEIRQDDLVDALKHLQITTTLAQDWPPGWVNLGVAEFRSGNPDGALEAYGKALEVEPNHPSALTNMAYVYRELGWESEADDILRAAASESNHPFVLIALAHAEMLRGNYDEAADSLRRARRRYRNVPELWEAMARLARYEQNMSKADRCLAKAAKMRKRLAKGGNERSELPTQTTNTMLPPR